MFFLEKVDFKILSSGVINENINLTHGLKLICLSKLKFSAIPSPLSEIN